MLYFCLSLSSPFRFFSLMNDMTRISPLTNMKKIMLVALFSVAFAAHGQNSFPPCSSENRFWDMCVGAKGKYNGEWKKGTYNGLGTYVSTLHSPTGDQYIDKYVGEWKNGLYDGIGVYTVSEGNKTLVLYSGEFKNGSYNGKGTLTLPTGEYRGHWINGKINGKGTYTHLSAARSYLQYEGEWKDGKFEGQGTYLFPDGGKYEGMFNNGKPDGLGKEVTRDGLIRSGLWKDGIFITILQGNESSPSDIARNRTSLFELASQGNADAQFQYGMTFINGKNDEIKPRVAIEWLQKAASQGHQHAQKQIAAMFDLGIRMSNMDSSVRVN